MKYRRLKTLDSTGVPILRYYELDSGEAAVYANAFYGVEDGKASKLDGDVGEDVELIGFSHGGGNLAEGLLFLDVNTTVVYMGILEDGDEGRPEIGNVVFGYQKVIDTHYDGDDGVNGKGTIPGLWGVETMDNPYYLFTIVQPEGTAFDGTLDDGEAGEISGGNFKAYPTDPGRENDTPGDGGVDNP